MKTRDLILHCYAEKKGDQWQAFCLDLSLAAQGDSFQEVRRKLDDMIGEYVYDAMVGEDRDFAFHLLKRRAPLRYWAKFYIFLLLDKAGVLSNGVRHLFCPPIPMEPSKYKHA